MPGFINSPSLAKLVALQMADENLRSKRGRTNRTSLRARLGVRRTARSATVKSQRVSPTGKLVEGH